jgi:hypothetical protein
MSFIVLYVALSVASASNCYYYYMLCIYLQHAYYFS